MKKLIIASVIFFLAAGMLQAQKFAYVDSQYILENLPEYTEAQVQLDEVSAQWQKDIEAKFAEVDKMYQDYQAQAVLLPEDMKKKKEQEIVDREKEAKSLQRQRFGQNGDLMKKRQELVKPIQERVYNAIQDIATTSNYSVVFDKSGALTILFASPKYDISDEVLDNLGASSASRKGRSQPGKQKSTETGTGGSTKGTQQNEQPKPDQNMDQPGNAPDREKK